jgi:NADH:ubiquinone oxidoreductase subunit
MFKRLKIFSALSSASMILLTAFRGRKMGEDGFGNRYYRTRGRRERRWVIYADQAEASLVPPEWHAWLHRQVQDPPEQSTASWRRPWQQSPLPNPTGTAGAYRPPGHVLEGGRRAAATGDYEAWTPPQ